MSGRAQPRRRGTGAIETYEWSDGRTVTIRARVRAYGRRYRVDFGTNHEGWNEERASVELDKILRQIERGTWEPPVAEEGPEESAIDRRETVHVTASRWWQRRKPELSENTRLDYRWRLDHVLVHIAHVRTDTLDIHRVDRLRQQLHAGGLAPRSVNMVLDLLAQVLDDAVEYGLLAANPARGKRRRMRVPKSGRSFLEPDMVVDLVAAGAEWEAELPPHQRYGRAAFLGALCTIGPRISELTETPIGRLDLDGARVQLGNKTEAGRERYVELPAYLAALLSGHLERLPDRLTCRVGPSVPLFPTRTGGRLNPSNVRNRLLPECVKRANEKRAHDGRMLLPAKVTPHTLRRTFASLALAVGRDPRWVMAQLGHTDARLTLNVYAQVMQRQRVDYELAWSLMRFADEPETWPRSGRVGPTVGPTRANDVSMGSGEQPHG